MSRLCQEIMVALKDYAKPVTWKQIAIRVSGTRKEIFDILSILDGRKWINRIGEDPMNRTYEINEVGLAQLDEVGLAQLDEVAAKV